MNQELGFMNGGLCEWSRVFMVTGMISMTSTWLHDDFLLIFSGFFRQLG